MSGTDHINADRDELEAAMIADEIREGLDQLYRADLHRLSDAMRDRMLISAARKLRGAS